MEETKNLLYGIERNGEKVKGLYDLSKSKLDRSSKYYETNLKQQSGYAAEMLSTYKENIAAKIKGIDSVTYRTDDLKKIFSETDKCYDNIKQFSVNDPFVDKIRMNSNGEVIERIQTKFIGKNGNEWLSKMMSSKFEKYLDGEHVDKLECPKDYYNEAKAAIPERIAKLEEQIKRVKADGKIDVVEKLQNKIDKYTKIDQMIEQSNTTNKEAAFARLHPKLAAAKTFAPEVAKLSNTEGLKGGALAAGLTFTVSTVDNVSSFIKGDITAGDMVKDITKDTAAAGALGYGTSFVSTAVAQTMKESSKELIRSVGGSNVPMAVITFGVESYDSITDFAKGEISGSKLAYDLGENASSVAGAVEGAEIGAAIGTPVGPVGTVAGAVIGGAIGCAVTSEVYKTAVEVGSENVEKIADKAQEFASSTIDTIAENAPEALSSAKTAFNNFASSVKIPIHV